MTVRDEVIDDGRCFACGPKSEIGLRLRFSIAGDQFVRAQTTLEQPFQGWVGVAHGGIVMTLLDEGMAHAAGAAGYRGVTGEIKVRFRNPVRIGAPIIVEGRVLWERGRVLGLESRVVGDADVLLASAEGRFVVRGRVTPGTLGVPDLG
ncbi:MAG: PaaI family thioesterase [Candidatus Eremiobacteraeota bacterium]|nr:PaaI family thioesterase [Candidatus Eremiobacteraeota bacterium]